MRFLAAHAASPQTARKPFSSTAKTDAKKLPDT